MADFKFPTCAVCNQPVEKFEKWVLPGRQGYEFIAYCHGRRQAVRLTENDLYRAGQGGIAVTYAFVDTAVSESYATHRIP